MRFHAIEVDSRPGELEYDRALATAKRLDAAVAEIVAAAEDAPRATGGLRGSSRCFLNGGSATLSVCVASNARKQGYFRALSAWREGPLGAYPRYPTPLRRPPPPTVAQTHGGSGRHRPGPPPQNLLQETNT